MPDKVVQADGSVIPIVAVAGSAGAGAAPTSANATPTVDATLTPKGYQQISSASLATAQALTPPAGSRVALIQAEAQAMRWRDDGTAPTATVGMLVPAGGSLEYNGDLTAIRLIAATAGAIANVTYYA
ncbi:MULTISPECIES: hypothetical protein [unclassified Achromobacter]|uniref:hypothetical protein n=1 Tax=unclassified Achromobacter TaxID=2626865 RepID=UPI000B518DF3|nr:MULTISPECIES: hypothetical protein [unclassified Achromobacter]OWT68087.1 hypothetical protein CEY05_29065 [Achromobacter sp. HZ34]OWT69924.1 hypothetical protein CEY04_27895 [Achromobacter sp. HZ28]